MPNENHAVAAHPLEPRDMAEHRLHSALADIG
jgi:hypothetical protein